MILTALLPSGGCNNNLFRTTHPQGFRNQHALYLAETGYNNAACRACHGVDLKGDKGPSCQSCHTNYPHVPNWVNPVDGGDHKLEVGAKGFQQCQPCHGLTYDGDQAVPGCGTCHPQGKNYGAVPHRDPAWPTQAGHGAEVKKNSTSRCEVCHVVNDPDRTETKWPDGTVLPTCYKCHAGPTGKPTSHTDPNWSKYSPTDPTTHAGKLLTESYDRENWRMDLSECTSCHFDNGKLWSTCERCHAPYPKQHSAYYDGWQDPGAPGSPNPDFHGAIYNSTGRPSCASCHGPDLKGGNNSVACDLCHAMPQ